MLPAGSSPLSQGMEVDPPRLGEPPREQDDDLSEGSGVMRSGALWGSWTGGFHSMWFHLVSFCKVSEFQHPIFDTWFTLVDLEEPNRLVWRMPHASRVADAMTDVVRNLLLTRLQDSSWKISQVWIPLPAAFSPVYIYIYIVFLGDQVATPYSIHSPSFSTHILAVYILPSQSLSLWFKWSTPDGLLAGFEEDEAPDPPPGEHWQEFDSLQQVVLKLGDIHQIPTLHFFF